MNIALKFKLIFITAIILLTFGCTTKYSKENDILCIYKGQHINEIVYQWGEPIKSFIAPNGNPVYVFYKVELTTVRGAVHGKYGIFLGEREYIQNIDTCTAYLETSSDGMIVRCSFEGNACEKWERSL